MLKELAILKDSQPDNAALQCCDALFGSLADDAEKDALLRCVQSGMRAPESHVGCLAMDVRDYERFKLLFGKAISRHHGMEAGAMHSNILDDAGRPLEPTARVAAAWSLEDVEGVPANGLLDLANASLEPLPMRCQAARNFGTFPLSGGMSTEERVAMEAQVLTLIEMLIAAPEFGGRYVSLTPGHANAIDDAEHAETQGG